MFEKTIRGRIVVFPGVSMDGTIAREISRAGFKPVFTR
jgi:hypothetical protein